MAACTFTFDELLHEYRDDQGIVMPSTTQVLKAEGLISFDGINPRILERKRQLGSLVHQITQLVDQGNDPNDFEIPEAVFEYLTGYINFRDDSGFVPNMIEQRMLGEIHGMRWGMTPDRTGPINGVEYVIELKCGAASHPSWGVQLASYDLGLNELHKRPRLARAAVQLGPQFPRGYKLHPYEDPADYQIWMNSLANTIWKQNKGLYQSEDVPERLVA